MDGGVLDWRERQGSLARGRVESSAADDTPLDFDGGRQHRQRRGRRRVGGLRTYDM